MADQNRELVEEVIAFGRRGRVLFGEALPRDVPVKVVASVPEDFKHAWADGKAHGGIEEGERTFAGIKAEQRALYPGVLSEDSEKNTLAGHAKRLLKGSTGPLRAITRSLAVLKCGNEVSEVILDDLVSCAEWRAAFGMTEGFWESVFQVYKSGGMPVGWSGDYPAGCLMAVYPQLRGAKKMLDSLKLAHSPEHEYVSANLNEFRYLDLQYYDRMAEELVALGFRLLGDVEDKTMSQAWPHLRSFLRCLTGREDTVIATVYHVKLLGWWRVLTCLRLEKNTRAIDLETEFTDGCFISTSNAIGAASMTAPSQIACEYHPAGTPAAKLLEIHSDRLAGYLRERPDVWCVRIGSLDEALASAQRMNALRAAYRAGIRGGLLREEMERMAGWKETIGREALRQLQELDESPREE